MKPVVTVESKVGGHFYATCTCGWRGLVKHRSEAQMDAAAHEDRHRTAKRPEPAAPPVEPEPDVLKRLQEIARYLDGSEPDPIHGTWFLDKVPPDENGPYWWRRHLRKWVEAVAVEHTALREEVVQGRARAQDLAREAWKAGARRNWWEEFGDPRRRDVPDLPTWLAARRTSTEGA